jgi:hypothetical protein
MCGIFAVIPRTQQGLFRADLVVVKQMMLDTAQRGEHSTGFFMTDYLHPKNKPTGAKVLGGPHNIIYNEQLWKEIEDYMGAKGGCFIGHGRQATRGSVVARNAHPFQHEHITMVHNGTLHSGVSTGKKGDIDVEVDSHGLAVAMAERGVAEALTDITGAYAVIVHDAKEGCLYIARNDDRPLYSYSTKTRHYLMSEMAFMEAILDRHNLMEKEEVTRFVTSETLFKVDLASPKGYKIVADLKTMKAEKDEIKQAAWKAERDKREAEEDARRAANPNKYAPKKPKGREYPPKEPTEVAFIVKSVHAWKSNYRYECMSANEEPIHFISDQMHNEYLGRVGRAEINRYHVKDNVKTIFVKHKEIKWVPEMDAPALVEEGPAPAGNFRFANGKSIPAATWAQRLKDEGCHHCARTFTTLDYKTTILMDDDNFLCGTCNKEFQAMPDQSTARH